MLRFYDAGFRHLHEPGIEAVHMKGVKFGWAQNVGDWKYRLNHKNIAYTAGKHLRAREAVGSLVAIVATHLRDGLRGRPRAAAAVFTSFWGFVRGLWNRDPVSKEISRVYRRHFLSFASPWWVSRPLHLFLLGIPGALVRRVRGRRRPADHPGRWQQYFERGARYYPTSASTLEL
jgi:hypothetical protein